MKPPERFDATLKVSLKARSEKPVTRLQAIAGPEGVNLIGLDDDCGVDIPRFVLGMHGFRAVQLATIILGAIPLEELRRSHRLLNMCKAIGALPPDVSEPSQPN